MPIETVVTYLITLVTFGIAVATPIIKLNTNIARLNCTISELTHEMCIRDSYISACGHVRHRILQIILHCLLYILRISHDKAAGLYAVTIIGRNSLF